MKTVEEILVTPKQLLQTAAKWEELLKNAEISYEKLEQIAGKMEHCFQGRSAEAFRTEIAKRTKTGKEKVADMKVFPVKLIQMAEFYQKAEGENKNVLDRNGSSF